ncbi:hypothetical protein PI124_g16610 [Phytophthora idaei]|nr:hypothetical protein PI125_g16950 [Phytophthora idaei]KAG3140714.1 hypothetical protein PI126_g15849 [Phytophthora idaei]KAG3238436.1 hypothetical protein PI124_g16610 [Phytophthora idaei]
MYSKDYEDPDAVFSDVVSEIFRTEDEKEHTAVLQQVTPPATPPCRTVTPDSSSASSEDR